MMKRFALFLSTASLFFHGACLVAVAAPTPAIAQDESEAEGQKSIAEESVAEGGETKAEATDEREPKADDTEASEKKEIKSDAAAGVKGQAATKADEKAGAESSPRKRKTYKVEPKRLKIDLTLDGTFVAQKMEEVPLRPDSWTGYEIEEVVEHGAKVRKGETLIKFDSEKIDEAISDLELDQRISELAILKADEELPRMEKTLRLDLEEAERANEQARENFERYKEIDRPMAVKSAEFMVRYYDSMLNYEKDELDQLEKMYEADDLTEDTEEIVLKRQRNSVEFAEFGLESAKIDRDETLKVRLPRADIRIKDALERTKLALAQAQTASSLDLNRARYEQEQRKKARTKSLDKHAKLLADRELMEIKSPADGIVFYGQNVNGRWSDTQTLINKYKPHSNVTPGSILMTIVEPRPIYVTSTVDEGKRPEVEDGQKAKIVLPSDGSDRADGDVKSISSIPVSPGKFEINFDVEQQQIPDWVMPGMSCKVQITTYNKKDALIVPKAAIRDDEDDEDKKFVWLVDSDDDDAQPERRDVKLGKSKGNEIEVVKGLKKGDVVSLEDESEKEKGS